MKQYLNIWLEGVDGSIWHLSGAKAGDEGAFMLPKLQKFIDAPAQTLWVKSGYRSHYQGVKFERRDPVFKVHIYSNSNDPDDWQNVESRFRMALGMYDQEFTIGMETVDGARTLKMRLLDEPKAYQGEWEGKDPHLYAESSLDVSAAASQPFWVGQTIVQPILFPSGSGTKYVTVSNPGDVAIWLRWRIPAPSKVTLPDWSWGQESAYSLIDPDDVYTPADDSARVWSTPTLVAGEHLKVNSAPDRPLMIAANGANVPGRAHGTGLLYPVAPHTPPTQVPVVMTGGPTNATVYLENDQWYSRPWGVTI